MLSISKPLIGLGRLEYYLLATRNDYYTNGGEPPGRWAGGLARHFALEGEVDPVVLRQLWQGYSPDGSSPLVQNAGDPERRGAWDLTFSAPKSVSVFWSQASPDLRAVIEEEHAAAVNETLGQIEKVAAYIRSGKGGRVWERTLILAVMFPHATSRANDPAMHSHVLVLNLARRAGGQTGALTSEEFFRLKLALGAYYQATYANRLERRLGLAIEWKAKTFALRDVPRTLCREFSKRRISMLEVFAQTGGYSAVAAKAVALSTRPPKIQVPRAVLFDSWQQAGRKFGWSTAEAQAIVRLERQETLTPRVLEPIILGPDTREQANTLPTHSALAVPARTALPDSSREPKLDRDDSARRPTSEIKTLPGQEEPRAGRRVQGEAVDPQARTGQTRKALPDHSQGSEQERDEASGRTGRGRKEGRKESGQRAGGESGAGSSKTRTEDRARRANDWRNLAAAIRDLVPLEVRQDYPFWRAQCWNRYRSFHLPHLALKRRWKPDQVLGETKIPFARIQLRKGHVFPKAPAWNPASKLKTYRFAWLWNVVEKRKLKLNTRRRVARFMKGQDVIFGRTDKVLGVQAGQRATVVRMGRYTVTVRFADGTQLKVDLREYKHLYILRRQESYKRDQSQKQDQNRHKEERRGEKEDEKRRQEREAEARRRREEAERRRREQEASRQQSQSQSQSRSR